MTPVVTRLHKFGDSIEVKCWSEHTMQLLIRRRGDCEMPDAEVLPWVRKHIPHCLTEAEEKRNTIHNDLLDAEWDVRAVGIAIEKLAEYDEKISKGGAS